MKKLERKLKTSRETSQKLIQGKKAKMKRQEKINKEENGITLIALVITIVLNCCRSGRYHIKEVSGQ